MKHSLNTCCYPECHRLPRTRGLCQYHYNVVRTLVMQGKTTWEEQEQRGTSLPPNPEARHRWSKGRGTLDYHQDGR